MIIMIIIIIITIITIIMIILIIIMIIIIMTIIIIISYLYMRVSGTPNKREREKGTIVKPKAALIPV
jgi:uncharacterized SAM-binding protein YcdF (DUF218 family)